MEINNFAARLHITKMLTETNQHIHNTFSTSILHLLQNIQDGISRLFFCFFSGNNH